MRYNLLLILLISIPGCRHVDVSREYSNIKQSTKNYADANVVWESIECKQSSDETIEARIVQGLSRQEAVGLALQRNNTLQAAFEELGIAKSDLLQAGLFTNPRLDTVFRLPESRLKTNIEIDGKINISDFWLVPLRKQVSQDTVQIVTVLIIQTIMDVILQTKIAYDQCLYEQKQIEITQNALNKINELYEHIVFRKRFGFTSDYDIDLSAIEVNKWRIMLLEHKTARNKAFTELRRLMGITVDATPLELTDILDDSVPLLPSETLLETAYNNRPEIHIATIKIEQAKHLHSLEKGRVIDDLEFGLSYKQDFESPQGWGPSLGLSLPIFDTNKGNRKRTEYLLQQAEAQYQDTKQHIAKEVIDAHQMVLNIAQRIEIYYQEILPATKHAIEYAQTYFDRMQLNMTVLIETQLKEYELQKELLHNILHMAQTKHQLERALAAPLNVPVYSQPVTRVTFVNKRRKKK